MSVRKCWNGEVISMTADAWEETIKQLHNLEQQVEQLQQELEQERDYINALEAAGVDNWDGYSYAMSLLNGEEDY